MVLLESRAMDALEEIAVLRTALAEREAELATARAELTGAHLLIEHYKAQLHKLRRMQFGRSSEALDQQIHQLELKLEDLEEGEAARVAARRPKSDQPGRERRPGCSGRAASDRSARQASAVRGHARGHSRGRCNGCRRG